MKIIHKIFHRVRERTSSIVISPIRKLLLSLQGLSVGNTSIPRILITWPHKVSIGDNCIIEPDVYFKHDGNWSEGKSIVIGNRVFLGRHVEFNIRKFVGIGDDALIASGCKFIDHDHGFSDIKIPMNKQDQLAYNIIVEEDAWLGVNVIVLKGVKIGRGAIVAAGAVVNKSIPAYEIWGGIPARKLSDRRSKTMQQE